MPLAKRRKAYVGQEVEKGSGDGSRFPNEVEDISVPTTTGLAIEDSDPNENGDEEVTSPCNKITLSASEKESSKRGRSKSLGDAMSEVKIKEEAMKQVRISERLSIKRNRLGEEEEGDTPAPIPKKQKTTSNASKQPKKVPTSTSAAALLAAASKSTESTVDGKKKKKNWAPWSVEETKLFFTYLGVYGKNYDAISERMSYIAKMRKVEPRNKVQVRYFYYRAMNKVSKVLQLEQNGGVRTAAQEVYNLINFGALRKRIKETNPQFPKCLKELIQKGETTYITINGRNRRTGRLKTPVCAYFKELKKDEEKRVSDAEVCKLPTHVTIELTPKSSTAWSRVQEISQNPRVRFKLSTNRTLESVFKYLNSKWKSHRLRIIKFLTPHKREAMDDKTELCDDELVFHLPASSEVTPFTMKPIAKSKKKENLFKSYIEQVFPNLLTPSMSDPKEDDQTESTPRIEKGEEEGKQAVQEVANGIDSEMNQDQSSNTASPVKNEPGDVLVKAEQSADLVEEEPNGLSEKEQTAGSNGFHVSVFDPKGVLAGGNTSECDKKDNATCIKSEPLDEEEETSGESTSDQYLDFTPNGNLTVVSKSSQSKSGTASSSCVSSSTSSSTASTSTSLMPLKTEPQQISPTRSTNGSFPPSSPTFISSTVPLSTSPNTISSPLRSLANALNLKPVSTTSPPPSSSSSSTPSSNLTSTHSLFSPSSNNKKGAKKKINFCDINNLTTSGLDSNNDSNHTTNSDSQSNNDNNDRLMKEVDKEFERLHSLAKSGFLLSNSNTVTLLHLCLLLGRASVIRLEYEWVKKPDSQSHQHHLPAFCSPSNPIANSLRRLCHIAALELATSKVNHKHFSTTKEKAKSGTAESSSKKKSNIRNVGTMTDNRLTMPRHSIPIIPAGKIIHHYPYHHHQQNHKIDSTIQVKGVNGAEVFRVPVVPAYRPVISKEEEEKLKLQQQQAKAIMQENVQRSRLLKRRNVPRSRSKPIIVQRTLLPKAPNEQMITYIQPSTSHSQVLVTNGFQEASIPSSTPVQATATTFSHVACNSMAETTNTITTTLGVTSSTSQPSLPLGTNILELAVQSANITASPVKDESSSNLSSLGMGGANHTTIPAMPLLTSPPTFTSRENISLSIADQSNISISDFDISMAASNMGPDAGDKFLDSVLERSQQGFAGLITPVTKSNSQHPPVIGLDSSLSAFDLSGIKTPPRTSSPPSPSHIIHSSPPSKMSHPDQSWLAGESADVSLSSILGEFSSFQGKKEPKLETPVKSSVSLFDQSSSDAVDNSVVVTIPKPPFVSDVSLNSLLGDSALTSPVINVDSHHHLHHHHHHDHQTDGSTGHTLENPPPSLFSEVSQDSLAKLDVDVTLQGMVNDSSMDLVSKFEKLAAQMAEHQQDQELAKPNSIVK